MATSLGGWFDKVFFDAHGEPCASGELRFYQTGTDIPQGVATFDGTPLGSVIRLDDDGRPESDFRFYTDKIYRVVLKDADGVVVKTIDGVAIPEGEGGGGMSNPMTDEGDMIFGGPAGAGRRIGIGVDGDILAVAAQGGGLSPKWEAGPKKYRKVLSYVPTPSIDDGFLGCLYYLSGTAKTIELPPATNIPSKSFVDFVFLDNVATLTITPQGGSVLNAQSSAITIGGQAASMYRLTFLGRGDIGGVPTDQWALGGSVSSGGGGSVETMQENFSLLDSTDHYDTSTRGNRIYASKVVSNFTAKRTKLGFFHEAGTFGAVLLGVYDNDGNLLATTAAETPTSETFKKMRWLDTAAPFDMVAGEEYYFVAYFTEAPWSLTIDALGMEKTSTFDANFIGSASATAGLSALPATIPALTPDSLAFYIAAR